MPKNELAEEIQTEIEMPVEPVDVLIGITGVVDFATLRQRAEEAMAVFASRGSSPNIVVAYPGDEAGTVDAANDNPVLRFMQYALPGAAPGSLPWEVASSAQRALCLLALEIEARACVTIHSDLSMLQADRLELLTYPLREKQCDLVMPVYPSQKFDGLLNHGMLAPLARALYGIRIQYPLPPDIGCSERMCRVLAETQSDSLMWPATLAALSEYQICQINTDVRHAAQTEGLELSSVLNSLAGSAFSQMELYAAQWQRLRGSQATVTWGNIAQQVGDGDPVDSRHLVDSFLLGSRNLEEVWRLVLPPVTLLELKKLSRLSPEAFRIPDELWVRIIYDFALAHRLRTISRGHLLGALTPLYLGWVASYVQEAAAMSPMAAEHRLERLARAYEEGKPYLLSRWRWPDRFNP